MSAAPGWYPDPSGSPDHRFWDGASRTAQNRPAAANPAGVQATMVGAGVAGSSRPIYDFYGSAVPSAVALNQPAWSNSSRPAPKNHRRLFGGIAVAVVAVAAVVVVAVPMLMGGGSVYDRTHIAMPGTAAGYKRLASVDSKLTTSFTRSMPLSGARFGAYTDAAGAPLDTSGLTAVAPGPLGGHMQCGVLQTNDSQVATCLFADEGAQGLLAVNNASLVDTSLMLRLRAAIEKRS